MLYLGRLTYSLLLHYQPLKLNREVLQGRWVLFNMMVHTIYCDNQLSTHSSKHVMFHYKLKHVDIKIYFIRDIADMLTKLIENNPFDMLTKLIPN